MGGSAVLTRETSNRVMADEVLTVFSQLFSPRLVDLHHSKVYIVRLYHSKVQRFV